MSVPYINIYKDGMPSFSISADLCEIATISFRQESKEYEFVVSDLSFSLRDESPMLYLAVKRRENIEIVVQDDREIWFRGHMSPDGCGWKPKGGNIAYHAVSSQKKFITEFKATPLTYNLFWQVYVFSPDMIIYPMSQSLRSVSGLEIVPGDFTQYDPVMTYLPDDQKQIYSVYEYIIDCAYQSNSVFWIDEHNRLRLTPRNTRGSMIEFDDDLMCSYEENLRSSSYDKILFSSVYDYSQAEIIATVERINALASKIVKDQGNEDLKEQMRKEFKILDAARSHKGRLVMVEESLSDAKLYPKMPEGYNYNRVLDMRVPKWARGKDEPITNSIFPLLGVGSPTNVLRRGDWDSMMQPITAASIGLRELVKVLPRQEIKIRDIVGTVIESEYDLVEQKTILTVDTPIPGSRQ